MGPSATRGLGSDEVYIRRALATRWSRAHPKSGPSSAIDRTTAFDLPLDAPPPPPSRSTTLLQGGVVSGGSDAETTAGLVAL